MDRQTVIERWLALNHAVVLERELAAHAVAVVLRQARLLPDGRIDKASAVALVVRRDGPVVVVREDDWTVADLADPYALAAMLPGEPGFAPRHHQVLGQPDRQGRRWTGEWPYAVAGQFSISPLAMVFGSEAPPVNLSFFPLEADSGHPVRLCSRWREQLENLAREQAKAAAVVADDIPWAEEDVAELAREVFDDLAAGHCAAVARVARHLDAEAASVLSLQETAEIADYNWLVADGDAVVARRRCQAATVYPLLLKRIRGDAALTAAVDAGASLNDALRQHFSCGSAALRAVQGAQAVAGLRAADTPPTLQVWLPAILQALDGVPAEWHPRDTPAWKGFFATLMAALEAEARGVWSPSRLREVGPDWTFAAARLDVPVIADLADMRDGLRVHVLEAPILAALPTWSRDAAMPETIAVLESLEKLLFLDRPMFKKLEVNRDWHARLRRLLPLLSLTGPQRRWPALVEPHRVDGFDFVCLTDELALWREAVAMDHCVSQYADKCASGQSQVVSIRRDGEPVATAELRISSLTPEPFVSIVQVRGHQNRKAPPEAEQAMDAYWDTVLHDPERLNPNALSYRLGPATRQTNRTLARRSRVTRANLPAAFEHYRPLLPGRWKRMTFETFLRESGLAATIAGEMAVEQADAISAGGRQ